jgi:hypothetical protein
VPQSVTPKSGTNEVLHHGTGMCSWANGCPGAPFSCCDMVIMEQKPRKSGQVGGPLSHPRGVPCRQSSSQPSSSRSKLLPPIFAFLPLWVTVPPAAGSTEITTLYGGQDSMGRLPIPHSKGWHAPEMRPTYMGKALSQITRQINLPRNK